ncbi:class I SAM-dependent methyltransferase [Nocardioides rubriscoriae]|uniref:class I SAM-dependent methyltransferase n=1 Tax=Nocardioides rubriscoriae TaxID=642762 RepID=UPI0011DF478E|nr:class I SAM-dependent methyltransferase [Nocardioides rubriscoriae]
MTDRPQYDRYVDMAEARGPLAARFADQALATTAPWRSTPTDQLHVLDLGCGYGHTALALATRCRSVVGVEPARRLYDAASTAGASVPNATFVHGDVTDLDASEVFDLVLLDNVYEHLPEHEAALAAIRRSLRPGGVLFLLTPNKLWPVEAHYRLPGLAWLPLRWADLYLRATRRGESYEDASYAPTYWALRRSLEAGGWDYDFVLPADPGATVAGAPWHYRAGMRALDRVPALWAISKALLVVARKPG